MKPKNTPKKQLNTAIRQFGYIISAILIILTVFSQYMQWTTTPWFYLLALYFLTGSLWIPVLIKPFYLIFGKYLIKVSKKNDSLKTGYKLDKN